MSRARELPSFWSTIDELAARDTNAGWGSSVRRLCELLPASWGYTLLALHDPDDPGPVAGWHVPAMLHPVPEFVPDRERIVAEWMAEFDLRAEPTLLENLRQAGTHRVLHKRSMMGEAELRQTPTFELWRRLGVGDELIGAHSLSPRCEVWFCFNRSGEDRFDEDDAKLLLRAIRGLGRMCRWLALSRGLLPGMAPLSDREQAALPLLLGPQPLKVCAGQVGMNPPAFRQLARSVYQKLGVTSRPELMALWLRS